MARPLAPLNRISQHFGLPASPSWEMGVRYTAAYVCTLIAIAAAQLLIPTGFAMVLSGICLLGLPISLMVRQNGFHIGRREFSRLTYSRLIVVLATAATIVFLVFSLPELFNAPIFQIFLRVDTIRVFSILIEFFLIVATSRSLVILNDKDAVLCTVPSFAVLLLLIVVHKGPEVVTYFLLWAIVTAILFALDHRSEARQSVSGYVPSIVPGQDIAMSTRSLVIVVVFSMACAFSLSSFLAARDPDARSPLENYVVQLASQINGSMDVTDSSVNAGPERQIDFSSGPALPTRALLWQVRAVALTDRPQRIFPNYLRMFTLPVYDGKTWSQSSGSGAKVSRGPLTVQDWPLFMRGLRNRRYDRPFTREEVQEQAARSLGFRPWANDQSTAAHYGQNRVLVYQNYTSMAANTGYLPHLPTARALDLPNTHPDTIRSRDDDALDIGVLNRGESAEVLSEMPSIPEYGGAQDNHPPLKKRPIPASAPQLSAEERRLYLALPTSVTQRVRDFAKARAAGSADDSAYARALRLRQAVEQQGAYTLRPPNTPEDRDAVDYFLFESRRGYCTYFASALTVLCRTQGIPARIVSGFVNVEWAQDPDNGFIRGFAREANAHAWTEIWVDGWGWAVLDATPADDRGDNAPGFWDNTGDFFRSNWANAITLMRYYARVLIWAGAGLLMAVVVTLAFGRKTLRNTRASWRLSRAARQAQKENDMVRAEIIEAYRQAAHGLAGRYRQRASWETPIEWLSLAETYAALPEPEPWRTLTQLYTCARYSLQPLTASEGQIATTALREILDQKK